MQRYLAALTMGSGRWVNAHCLGLLGAPEDNCDFVNQRDKLFASRWVHGLLCLASLMDGVPEELVQVWVCCEMVWREEVCPEHHQVMLSFLGPSFFN
jgi:hypothetical protein